MGIRSKGLVLAMEADNSDGVVENLDEVREEADQASGEMLEDAGDADELLDAAEDAGEDAETLERIQGTMEDAVESGEGIDETAAEIAEVAVESICARLGIRNTRAMPATESFGSSSSRVTATKIAIEGLAEMVKKTWEAIKAAIANAWAKIKQLFMGFTSNNKKIVAYLEGLKTRAEDLSDDAKPAEKKLKNKSLAASVSVKKKASLDTALAILDNTATVLNDSGTVIGNFSTIASAVAAAANSDKTPDQDTADITAAITSAVSELQLLDTVNNNSIKGAKSAETKYYGPFANTKAFSILSVTTGNDTKVTFGVEKLTKIAAEEAEALTKAQIVTLLDKAIEVATQAKVLERVQKEADKVNKELVATSNTVMKLAVKADENLNHGDKAAALKKLESKVKAINSVSAKLSAAFPALSVEASKAAGAYAVASMSNLKKKEK